MSLKLFRHTGFTSILAPGETRIATHPLWAVLAVSTWIGLVCNVWLWKSLIGPGPGLQRALALGVVVAGAVGFVLSLLGWRRTFKLAATLLLLLAALLAAGILTRGITLDTALAGKRVFELMPAWVTLLGWQVPTLLVVLGLVPMLWLWNKQLRRLTGSAQLQANLGGMALAALVVVGAGAWLAMLPATPAS